MKVKDLLTEKTWTKTEYALDASNNPVDPRDVEATRWCLIGAMILCYANDSMIHSSIAHNDYNVARYKLETVLGHMNIAHFNDTATFAEIKSLVERADI